MSFNFHFLYVWRKKNMFGYSIQFAFRWLVKILLKCVTLIWSWKLKFFCGSFFKFEPAWKSTKSAYFEWRLISSLLWRVIYIPSVSFNSEHKELKLLKFAFRIRKRNTKLRFLGMRINYFKRKRHKCPVFNMGSSDRTV